MAISGELDGVVEGPGVSEDVGRVRGSCDCKQAGVAQSSVPGGRGSIHGVAGITRWNKGERREGAQRTFEVGAAR